MKLRPILCAGVALAAAWSTASPAVTFDFTPVAGDTLTPDEAAAFATAAAVWSKYLADPVTVDVQIGFRPLQSTELGETSAYFALVPTSSVEAQLALDATSGTDALAVASLAGDGQSALAVTAAEASALGYAVGAPVDGIIEFSSDYAYSTARDASGAIAAGTYDLVGIAEHEIGHLLGFDSGLDAGGSTQTLLDQFRYAAAGQRGFTSGAPAYFSVDGGTTDVAGFATGADYQASHWLDGTAAVMKPALAAGVTQDVTGVDLVALDAIGWDLTPAGAALAADITTTSAVPEPGAWTTLLLGVVLVGGVLRRTGRRRNAAPAATAA